MTKSLSLEGLDIVQLKSKPATPFTCGKADLNDFFQNYAFGLQEELFVNTFCLVQGNETVAMFSICNDSIPLERKAVLKISGKGKHTETYPAVKLARLGVANKWQGNGAGSLILNFLIYFFIINNKTGCRYLIVDAYNKKDTLKFYKNNGFEMLEPGKIYWDKNETIPFFYDLKPTKNAMAADPRFPALSALVKKVITNLA
jgi:GNAT superfamily N-acetyltransferase